MTEKSEGELGNKVRADVDKIKADVDKANSKVRSKIRADMKKVRMDIDKSFAEEEGAFKMIKEDLEEGEAPFVNDCQFKGHELEEDAADAKAKMVLVRSDVKGECEKA